MLGLDDNNQYVFRDLFRFYPSGRDADGRILGEMRPTGELPTFSGRGPLDGLRALVKLTADIFKPEEAAGVGPMSRRTRYRVLSTWS